MTKPASAPPADSLQAIVEAMRRPWIPNVDVSLTLVQSWADRLEALAASAQVPEVEAWGYEFDDAAGVHHVVKGPLPSYAQSNIKPAPEPVPVAQGIARFDFTEGGFEEENERGHYVRHADHARRVAELESELAAWKADVERLVKDDEFIDLQNKANALEASLAACRALLWRVVHDDIAGSCLEPETLAAIQTFLDPIQFPKP